MTRFQELEKSLRDTEEALIKLDPIVQHGPNPLPALVEMQQLMELERDIKNAMFDMLELRISPQLRKKND